MPPRSPRSGPEPSGISRSRMTAPGQRSEEHTSELQSQSNLVCRLLLEKKKSTGYVASRSNPNDDAAVPIFNVEQEQVHFSIAADFVAAQVANYVLILAPATGRIFSINV